MRIRSLLVAGLAMLVGTLVSAPADAARPSDRRVCDVAKQHHAQYTDELGAFMRSPLIPEYISVVRRRLEDLERVTDRYRRAVRDTRGATTRGRSLRSALLRFTSDLQRANRRFEQATRALETDGDTSEPYSDGLQIVARASARLSPTVRRSRCALPMRIF